MARDRQLIVSVSGIRGIVGDTLTPQVAVDFAASLGTYTNSGKIIVSRDGRPSGEMLGHAVSAGLLAAGCGVIDIGVAPTPTVGVAIRHWRAEGAVQITASHNPSEWNGMKLFGADGRVLPSGAGEKIKAVYQSRQFRLVGWDKVGRVELNSAALDVHCDRVFALIDVEKISGQGLSVFLDANGGAGGPLGKKLLASLNCRVTEHACGPDGIFRHEPEPLAENLTEICRQVPDSKSDIGFVLDPDADRLALIDETGRYIGEELTLALSVLFRLQQQPGPVVVNMSTSRITEDICKRSASPFFRSAVGEANVVDKMLETGAVIGGEGNGGVIDPRVGWVRDPFIGMGLILNLLADTGKKLSDIVKDLPHYDIVKTKCAVDRERLPDLFARLEKNWPEARADRADGLRLDWPDRWLHVRPSNTEPVVRIIAEAPTIAEAQKLCAAANEIIT